MSTRFGEKKPGGQFTVGAGGPHDDREWLAVQPDLQRLFRRGAIGVVRAAHAPHADDVHVLQRHIHAVILPRASLSRGPSFGRGQSNGSWPWTIRSALSKRWRFCSDAAMSQPSARPMLYKGYRFPPAIVSCCVSLVYGFGVSLLRGHRAAGRERAPTRDVAAADVPSFIDTVVCSN